MPCICLVEILYGRRYAKDEFEFFTIEWFRRNFGTGCKKREDMRTQQSK